MYLLTLLDLINEVVGNKDCYFSEQDETIFNIRKTEINKGKDFGYKMSIFLEKGKVKVNLLKIKLIIDMLYIVYIQFNLSSSVLKSCL